MGRPDYSDGELPLKAEDIGLGKGKVVAFRVGCALPAARTSKPARQFYFGEADLIYDRLKRRIELAGYEEMDKDGIMAKVRVYLRSRTKEEEVWVYYWIIESIGKTALRRLSSVRTGM